MIEIILFSLGLHHIPDVGKMVEDFHINRTTQFIVQFEGFHSCPYKDAGGYSVGYGSKSNGYCLTKPQARQIVRKEVERLDDLITAKYDLNYNQRMALVSFTYNTPVTQPALRTEFPVYDDQKVYDVFMQYAWLRGLKKRRLVEYYYFSL